MRAFVLVCLALLGALQSVQSLETSKISYIISRHQIDDIPKALIYIRRFIQNQNNEMKCQRYALLLQTLSGQPVDQYSIAELAIQDPRSVKQSYLAMSISQLRQLYIDGVNAFRDQVVDEAMLDLIDCLSKFKNSDYSVRSFFNEPDLKLTLEQYKQLIRQTPVSFLLDQDRSCPAGIESFDQLSPSMQRTVTRLFGDEAKARSRFTNFAEQPTVMNVQEPSEKQGEQVDQNTVLNEEDLAYMKNLSNLLSTLYRTLPLEANPDLCCSSYAKLIGAPERSLNGELVQQVVKEAEEQIKLGKNEPFVPEREVRLDFLSVVSEFGSEMLDPEIYFDVANCLRPWQKLDPEIEQFITNPDQLELLDLLAKELGLEAIEPVASAANSPATNSPGQPTVTAAPKAQTLVGPGFTPIRAS